MNTSGRINQNFHSMPASAKKIVDNTHEKKSLGYNSPPTDGYDSGNQEKGFVDRVVDGIGRFIENYIVGPGGKFANKLKSDFGTQVITASTMVGGATGAYIGYEAARIEAGKTQVSAQTWQAPVMYSKYLGKIPDDYTT